MFDNQKLQLKIAARKAQIAVENKKEAIAAKATEITSDAKEKIADIKSSHDEKTAARRAELEAEYNALTAN